MSQSLVVFSGSTDGYVESNNATYATAAASGTLSSNTNNVYLTVGQDTGYVIDEAFISFDTSSLPDDAIILSAVLSLNRQLDESDTNFDVEVRYYDWGASVTTADWVAAASLHTHTLAGKLATADLGSDYNDVTLGNLDSISRTGTTRFLLNSSRHRQRITPTGDEYVNFYSTDESGTTRDPKLTITYVSPSQLNFHDYDAYLDDTAVMFMETEGSEQLSQSIPSEAQRQDTGNNENEIRTEKGFFFAQADFSGGMGQERYHANNSDKDKYYKATGFNIDERGKLTHLRQTYLGDAVAADNDMTAFATADDALFVAYPGSPAADSSLRRYTDVATSDSVTDHPGGTVDETEDIAGAGAILLAACGADGIYQRSGAGTWTAYVTGTVNRLMWGTFLGRAMAIGGTDKRSIYEITTALGGASAALPSAIMTLPSGWQFGHMWEAGQFIYAPAYSTDEDKSAIFHFGLNSGATAIIAKGHTPMPVGELITGGGGFLNNSYLLGRKRTGTSTYVDICYQAFPDSNGHLQYIELLEGDNDGSAESGLGYPKRVLPIGDSVLIPWVSKTSTTDFFIGALKHNTARDALSYNIKYDQSAGNVDGDESIYALYRFRDYVVLAGKGGPSVEDKTKYVTEASLVTSMADFNTAGLKVWDRVDIDLTDPLPSGTAVEVYYTTSHVDEDEWTFLGVMSTTDMESETFYISDVQSRLFALKIVSQSNSAQTLAPSVRGFSVRAYPKPETSEWSLVRTVRVREEDRVQPKANKKFQQVRSVITTLRNMLHEWIFLYEPGETWKVYVKDMRVVEPKQAVNDITGGSPDEEAYIVTLSMEGTRQ